jgi:hypothetical protein
MIPTLCRSRGGKTMAARCSKEELLHAALAEIDPPEQKNAACCKSIDKALRLVDRVRVVYEAPAPGAFKKHVKAVADSLVKMKRVLAKLHKSTQYLVFRGLPEAVGPVDQDRFLKDVDRLILTCDDMIKHLQVSPGSRRWSAAKHTCALQASILLKEFSPNRLSKTNEGHFFNLASLLYEIASGEEEKDLSAYCEDLGRVEPLYVVKIPNVLGF